MGSLNNMKKKAQEATDKIKEVGASTTDKIKGIGTATTDKINEIKQMTNDRVDAILAEYQEAIVTLQAFGLKANKLHVDVTIPPEISVVIYGSMKSLDRQRIQETLEANREKKLLSAVLTALTTAARVRAAVHLENLNNLAIHISLGIPPSISVDVD